MSKPREPTRRPPRHGQYPIRAAQIAIVSVCVPNPRMYALGINGVGSELANTWLRLCPLARQNFRKYASLHGYQLHFSSAVGGVSDRPGCWAKVVAMQRVLRRPEIEFAFWMDADSLFMSFGTPLTMLLPRGAAQLVATGDSTAFLNNGHFLLRSGPWADAFLNETWATWPPPRPFDEQSAMIFVLTGKQKHCRVDATACSRDPEAARLLSVARTPIERRPPRAMNSYPEGCPDRGGANFERGDFIVHFAGYAAAKAPLMQEYARRAGRFECHRSILPRGDRPHGCPAADKVGRNGCQPKVASHGACEERCEATRGCLSYIYNRHGHCWLKDSAMLWEEVKTATGDGKHPSVEILSLPATVCLSNHKSHITRPYHIR